MSPIVTLKVFSAGESVSVSEIEGPPPLNSLNILLALPAP